MKSTESELVARLLKSLSGGVEPERQATAPGRRVSSIREAIYGAVTKVYSAQRADSDALIRVLEHPATTEILTRLIEESVEPLAAIDTDSNLGQPRGDD